MARIFFQRASSGFRTVRGELIRKIQSVLKDKGLYSDIVDGIYGDKTERALISFQQQQGLQPTGKVDEDTWQRIISEQPPSITARCLQLTADFEGTGFTKAIGNFDGAGLTWGIIGFTLFNRQLQGVLNEIRTRHPNLIQEAFGDLEDDLARMLGSPLAEQMIFAQQITIGRNGVKIRADWEAAFARLGLFPEVQDIQIERTQPFFDIALRDVRQFDLASELGHTLCFDIAVQNGGISQDEKTRILRRIADTAPVTEQDRRVIIANVVAENSRPRFIEDVRKRKLTVATSRGDVHGGRYDVKTWGLDELRVAN